MFVRLNYRTFKHGTANDVWFVFETPGETMQEVHETLVAEGRVFGTRYDTKPDGQHRRVILDVSETTIHSDGILSIQEMIDDLFEDDGTAVYIVPEEELAE